MMADETSESTSPRRRQSSTNTSKQFDHSLKLLLLGDSGVGKSSLLVRYAEKSFNDRYIATIGVDFKLKLVNIDGERVKLQLWDTAGQERFRTITSTYYRGTQGIMIVYDITSTSSFASIRKWIREIERNCEHVPVILVGNKMDMAQSRAVTEAMASGLSQELGLPVMEASAQADTGVDEAFLALARLALKTTGGTGGVGVAGGGGDLGRNLGGATVNLAAPVPSTSDPPKGACC